MRSPEDIQERWRATQIHDRNLSELQSSVKFNSKSSPCLLGLRSVCWKTFLLSNDKTTSSWKKLLRDGREDYAHQREHLLKYIKHPEALAELTVDPLTDDPDSPWDTARQDETIRAEIQQDVQRLPDEVNYHEDHIQTMILDILFVYCKVNPDRGGYRQGMHELLAPIVHVLENDAINRVALNDSASLDATMLELVDSSFIEHDAFILFSRLMDHAQSFYAVNNSGNGLSQGAIPSLSRRSSTIVERSKFIHEVCLAKVDPELASHLTSMEVLPQIFLIRWMRLLFSREFPFKQCLALWDNIFAVDPSLDLIDLICVAMLIRIRWQLLEGDYSVCLQLLLRYPPPHESHGPNTFIDDAVYLRSHLNAPGGSYLIMKYTGKMPAESKSHESRPSTPIFRGFNTLRQRGLGARSPLSSQPSFMNQQVGVEALFQGAAKGARGVFERGEKLGINQAVRDAMGEIRRNMQGFNESRYSPQPPIENLSDEGAAAALAAIERRNRQLASMLDETVASLKEISASNLDDKAKSLELIEIAAAKVQFVTIYLGDSSMELPIVNSSPETDGGIGVEDKSVAESSKAPEPGSATLPDTNPLPVLVLEENVLPLKDENDSSDTSQAAMNISSGKAVEDALKDTAPAKVRPAPIPTRSSLAQSSFSWMLEPEETSPAQSRISPKSSLPSTHKKRPTSNVSRDRSAFLFGEVDAATDERDALKAENIFGMEPLRKGA